MRRRSLKSIGKSDGAEESALIDRRYGNQMRSNHTYFVIFLTPKIDIVQPERL